MERHNPPQAGDGPGEWVVIVVYEAGIRSGLHQAFGLKEISKALRQLGRRRRKGAHALLMRSANSLCTKDATAACDKIGFHFNY